jgi:ADP-ribose pyrophosphatase YjhB (NUDIX family)
MKFCSVCGNEVVFGDLEHEHLPRFHCPNCKTIHYENPKIIVGCLPIWEDKVMLCRRAIEPQHGLWNIPGGFMENNESVEQGAAREMWEETFGRVTIVGLHTVFNVLPVNQVHLHFLAELQDLTYQITPESSEIVLFNEEDVPWAEIAFASSAFALKKYFEDRKLGKRRTHTGSLIREDQKWTIIDGLNL